MEPILIMTFAGLRPPATHPAYAPRQGRHTSCGQTQWPCRREDLFDAERKECLHKDYS